MKKIRRHKYFTEALVLSLPSKLLISHNLSS